MDIQGKQTDYNQIASRMMEANAYLIGTNEIGGHKAVWETRLHIACNNAIKDSFELDRAIKIHDTINSVVIDLRGASNIDGFHVFLKHLGSLLI